MWAWSHHKDARLGGQRVSKETHDRPDVEREDNLVCRLVPRIVTDPMTDRDELRDNITRTGATDPWGREAGPLAQRPVEARTGVDAEPRQRSVAEAGEGRSQLPVGAGMRGARLTAIGGRKAPSDRLASKPCRGQPAVRNFRGDEGDDRHVGIIRSPVR
jgi:hypothetical protein